MKNVTVLRDITFDEVTMIQWITNLPITIFKSYEGNEKETQVEVELPFDVELSNTPNSSSNTTLQNK